MRATIYCRISRDREGAGLGVGAQEKDCRELAASMGATVIEPVLTDNDLSAYSGKPRPGYKILLGRIVANQTDAVIVWHTDRLHRSPRELEDYIDACEVRGVRTITVKAGSIDLASPSGLVMARTLGAFARYEVDHARERMQRAKKRSADSGTWKGGRRPFGYESDGVTIRESEAELIRAAADQILAGSSVRAVAREWRAAGSITTTGKQWDLHAPRRVLLRPRNAGLMEHQGEVVGEAEWPAILEPEKWRSVVRILTEPSRRTNAGSGNVRYLGSGLYRCGVCGGGLISNQRGGVPVYRCRDLHVTRNRADLDDLVSQVIAERLRRPDASDLLRPARSEFDIRGLEARAVELRRRLDQLADIFAAGEIDAQQLSSGTRALNGSLDDVRAKIDAAYGATVLAEVGNTPDPAAAWLGATLDRRRAILEALVTVTVGQSPTGRPAGWRPGESYFRPESVQINWKE